MQSYFSWVEDSLKSHNLSIFGNEVRGPGRRKGSSNKPKKNSTTTTKTTTAVVSERRPPNRSGNRFAADLPSKRRISSLYVT